MTPGTHAHRVRRHTIKNDPQPLSTTDSGGKIIANNTRIKLMVNVFIYNNHESTYSSSDVSTIQEA